MFKPSRFLLRAPFTQIWNCKIMVGSSPPLPLPTCWTQRHNHKVFIALFHLFQAHGHRPEYVAFRVCCLSCLRSPKCSADGLLILMITMRCSVFHWSFTAFRDHWISLVWCSRAVYSKTTSYSRLYLHVSLSWSLSGTKAARFLSPVQSRAVLLVCFIH